MVSRSDIKMPSRGNGSKLTKVTQIITTVLCLKSQLSGLLPPLSLNVDVRIHSEYHSIKLANALQMSPKLCLPGKHSDTGMLSFSGLGLAPSLPSLSFPAGTLPSAQGTAQCSLTMLVVSGLGAYTVSCPQTLLCHFPQHHLPVPPLAWR